MLLTEEQVEQDKDLVPDKESDEDSDKATDEELDSDLEKEVIKGNENEVNNKAFSTFSLRISSFDQTSYFFL
ncbi:hypothetical protein ACA29_22760 [Lederbergia galactosidilytica]|uniref:Uncharacterized protein n=1 Tax=Lederbergia galactosidilytica TaxID=217031 RepID=A0A0Q9XMN2_9BACI|nr:hypothetical protein ACA29_22760 [Lederbergia galactosidilytica]